MDEEKISRPRAHSWGEFYETTKSCEGYSEEEKEKFSIFERLDKVKTRYELWIILKSLTKDQINWLNSPCLDGLVYSFLAKKPIKKIIIDRKDGFSEACRYYLSKKFDKRYLIWALNNGLFNTVRVFVEFGADINFDKNSHFEGSALYWACENGYVDIAKLLLNQGAKIDEEGFLIACQHGHIDIVKLLVEKGVDICAQKDKAFRKACSCGQTEIVKFLLDNGANVHANDEESLHWACLYGYEETVDILLQNGAVVQEKNIANIFEYTYYPLLVKLLSHYKGDLQPIYEKFSNRIETVKVFLEFFSKNKSLL